MLQIRKQLTLCSCIKEGFISEKDHADHEVEVFANMKAFKTKDDGPYMQNYCTLPDLVFGSTGLGPWKAYRAPITLHNVEVWL